MSEDKHTPAMPLADARPDHAPTDKPAAKGILYAILAVFVISVIAYVVITNNEPTGDDPGMGGQTSGQQAPAP